MNLKIIFSLCVEIFKCLNNVLKFEILIAFYINVNCDFDSLDSMWWIQNPNWAGIFYEKNSELELFTMKTFAFV